MVSVRKRHSRSGYLLTELVVGVFILTLVAGSIFLINQMLTDNVRDLEDEVEAQYYGQYVFDAVNFVDPLPILGNPGIDVPFYIAFQDNLSITTGSQQIGYSLDPAYRSRSVGFGLSGEAAHEIRLAGSGSHDGIPFRTYRIWVKAGTREATVYLTK